MPGRILRTPLARADLKRIAEYIGIENQSPVSAHRFLDDIEEKFFAYSHQPEMGESRPELGEGLRSFPFKKITSSSIAPLKTESKSCVCFTARRTILRCLPSSELRPNKDGLLHKEFAELLGGSKMRHATPPRISLPRKWSSQVKSAVLHVISLAHYAIVSARGRAVCDDDRGARWAVEHDRLTQDVALLREEIRLKDARMQRVHPCRRPHYLPAERMVILELRAARGWSIQQTADTLLVSANTIASWMKRIDEQGADALLQIREPVNKFPEFVRYIVQRLKVLCPALGKVKIAQILARSGLHLAPTTIGRMIDEDPAPKPADVQAIKAANRVVVAKRPNHVWHVDLTSVPTSAGLWTAWIPFALPQCWPFCWWVAVAIDHYSRRAMGFAVFDKHPTSATVRAFLGRSMHNAKPKYLICDRGSQFDCDAFKGWCKRKGIKPRFGAVGKQGKHRRRGTVYPDAEKRMYASMAGPAVPSGLATRASIVHRLVQCLSAAHDSGWQDAE